MHLELVEDITIRSFVMAFTRFANMWGLPSHLYNDNAKSFIVDISYRRVGGGEEKTFSLQRKITSLLTSKRILVNITRC